MKITTLNLFATALLLSSISFPALGGTTWTLDKSTFQVDTLYHAATGPGITQTSLILSGAAKERIFYTTIDLNNQYADIKVTTANDNAWAMRLCRQSANVKRYRAKNTSPESTPTFFPAVRHSDRLLSTDVLYLLPQAFARRGT